MANQQPKHEFQLTIEGIALKKASLDQITLALQRAFLVELVALDLRKGDLVYTPVMSKMMAEDRATGAEGQGNGGGGGSTGGAHASLRPAAET